MAEKITDLPPAIAANLTDLLETSQDLGGGVYISSKVTQQQVRDLIEVNLNNPIISGNVQQTANLAGAILAYVLTNTNNTNPNSHCIFYLISGGPSGGDAKFYTGADGLPGFYYGFDTSTGLFKVANIDDFGTGDAISVAQSKAVVFSGSVTISSGTITGITDLAIADGGTGASTYLGALRNFFGTSPNTQTGTTYTAASATDAYRKTLLTNASGCTVTVNDSSFGVNDEAFYQRATGAGVITFAAGAGVTIYSSPSSSFKINATTGGAWLFKSAANTYYLRGDLTP